MNRAKNAVPRFSTDTVKFLKKAAHQKRPDWLDKNRDEYERVLLHPLQHMAHHVKSELSRVAPGYHFPQKGIGRLKRPSNRVAQGGGLYKNWVSYNAGVPSESRFDHNPNLFFLINAEDPKDSFLVAGGLYMPSSHQLRSVREAISEDATAFEQLFSDAAFSRCFKGGFSSERKATRPPRGFDPNHPRMNWLKLQAFFVWRSYSKKEIHSAQFSEIIARDFRQILRLNALLDQAIQGRLSRVGRRTKTTKLEDRLEEVSSIQRRMDF